jgi:hypothetical protein
LEVSMKDMEKVKPFHYSHQGSLAWVFPTSQSVLGH